MPRAGRPVAAELWHLTNDITLYVLPAPGGRWQPALQTPSTDGIELLPLQPTQQDARDQAELAGRRVARMAMIADPATSDRSLAAFADGGLYNRADLAHLISGRLTDADTGAHHRRRPCRTRRAPRRRRVQPRHDRRRPRRRRRRRRNRGNASPCGRRPHP